MAASPEGSLRLAMSRGTGMDIDNVIRGIISDSFAYKLKAGKSPFIMRTDHIRGIVPIEFDRSMVKLLFFHLISNAMRYAFNEATIVIEAERTQSNILIRVTNRGIPLNPENVEEAMKGGWRSEEAQSISHGLGRGLAVSKRIMEAHHGTLTISPTTSEGFTIATVTFPILVGGYENPDS
jgi:signal transduction histidine kinase